MVTRISIDVLRSARFRREKLKSRSLTAPALYMPTRFPRISPLKLSEKGLRRVGADAASISSWVREVSGVGRSSFPGAFILQVAI